MCKADDCLKQMYTLYCQKSQHIRINIFITYFTHHHIKFLFLDKMNLGLLTEKGNQGKCD